MKVLVKYLLKSPFLDRVQNLEAGNLPETKVNITFPLEPQRGEKYMTGLSDKEAQELEKLNWLKEGDLTNPKSRFLEFEYVATFDKVGVNELDTDSPEDKLRLACLKARKSLYIEKESDWIKNPTAEFLIIEGDKTAEEKLSKVELRAKSLKEVETLNMIDCRNILLLMGERVDTLADKEIKARVYELADESPATFLGLAKDVKVPEVAELNDMIHYKVIVKSKGFYFTNDEEPVNLGKNKEDVIGFISDRANKDLVEVLKMRLSNIKSKK